MQLVSTIGKALAFSMIFFGLGYTLSFDYLVPPADASGLRTALDDVTNDFHADLDALDDAIDTYLAMANAPSHDPEQLRQQHLATRQAFKRVEYLLEFIEPITVKKHINGAPLPKTEPGVPEIAVIEPSGLQVLDELVFADQPEWSEIKKIAQKLDGSYGPLRSIAAGVSLQHRHVFEASFEEIVRVFTLGLTGFDTPGSAAALPEALAAFGSLERAYGNYAALVDSKDAPLNRSILKAFERARMLLQDGDFESFDRLTFLREVTNPLTTGLPRAQRLLGIETAEDFKTRPRPYRFATESIFDVDFLNAEYYANLGEPANAEQRRALGELLFFDPILSQDLSMSCATCHDPAKAFTDGKPKNPNRNSPTLVNSVYAERYFHDLREEFLERQMLHVVVDQHEFNTDFLAIAERLRQSETYRQLFAEAYADQPKYQLSKWSISDAISHYVMGLQGMNSDFDRYARGETHEIDPAVRSGFNLFMGKAACGTCHFAPSFAGLVPPFYVENETEVLGVPSAVVWEQAEVDPDLGRLASLRPEDEVYFNAYAFKTPTVRNAAVTAPYMHNGVYQDLRQVMDFYNKGGGAGIGIDLPHQTLPPDPLGLSNEEIEDVIRFMESLTDYEALVRRPAALPPFEDRPEWNDRYAQPSGR